MSERLLSIGIIGLGGVAQAHLQAIELLSCVRLIAVCDVRPDAAKEVAHRFSATPFTNYHELLEVEGLDLVMVLTPASTHRPIVEAVAAKGLPVFCEKPIAVSLEDAQAMVAACEQAGVKLFYGSSYRYLPAMIKARELIQAGAIGRVQLVTEQLVGGHGELGYQELPPIHYPLGGPGGPGMGLVDHGVHLIDTIPWLCDSPITEAYGRGHISGEAPSSEFMIMHLANGAIGHLIYNAATYTSSLPNEGMFSGGQAWQTDASVADAGGWENEPGSIAVYGSHGALRIFHYTNALFINTGDGPKQLPLSGRAAFGHFATQLETCVDDIVLDRTPAVPGAEGVIALSAMTKVYASMAHNKTH